MTEKLRIKLPNFFILGAAKCGTTALYHLLRQHPDIFMSSVKEPSFFCESFQVTNNPITYFELFDEVSTQKMIGEASHVYFTDPKSARILYALFPKAKFLIILRNPVDRAYSLYLDMRNHGWEKCRTFEKALEKEKQRKISVSFQKHNPQYFHNFMYFSSGLYGLQINRYLQLFDPSQFLFIRQNDLKTNFEKTMNIVFDFLEVDPSVNIDSKHHNETFIIRSRVIQKVIDFILPESSFKNRVYRHTYKQIPPISKTTRRNLEEKYKEDQLLLHQLTGIRFL